MKKALPYLLLLLVAGLLVWLKMTVFKKEEMTGGGPAVGGKRPPVPVTVQVVRSEAMGKNLFATGTVLPNEAAELRPEVSGKIVQLLIEEGSEVKAGQLLAKLNDAELQAQLAKARIEERFATETENRQKRLLNAQAISQEAYDDALRRLETLRADIQFLEAQIAKTEIRAPFDGVLGLKKVSLGSLVTPNDVLVTVLQTRTVKIECSVPEKYAAELHRGDRIQFTLEGSPETFSSSISLIAPGIDETNRSLLMRAVCPNPRGSLRPGAFVRVSLSLRETAGNLMVPTEAIVPVLKGKQVFVVRNATAQAVDVQTGLRDAARIQVLGGLQDGDSVVVTGVMNLRPGTPVKTLN
jgi:membrane fusion protein (multidrug efflux system)